MPGEAWTIAPSPFVQPMYLATCQTTAARINTPTIRIPHFGRPPSKVLDAAACGEPFSIPMVAANAEKSGINHPKSSCFVLYHPKTSRPWLNHS